jgi:arylsulfatase A-like enzyme
VGAVPRDARLVDVAPTIAALLGTRPPADAQGRALAESLNV